FADVMKKAGRGESPVEKPVKNLKLDKLKSGRNFRKNIAETGKLQILSKKFKALKSEDSEAVRIPGERTTEAETNVSEALLSNLVDHSTLSESQAAQSVPTENMASISSSGKRTRIRRAKSEKIARPDKTGNQTSSAPRVEVIDHRNRIQDVAAKSEIRGAAGRKQQRSESTGNRSEVIESVRVENRFASVETEIELSARAGVKGSERSAAAELARKLDAQAGNDIVRQVKVILNRSDAGEVQITLRPDNLGRVRVKIQMVDNHLTGRIYVESAAAREAFRSALDGLQTKLVESGFDAADLELAWDEAPRDFGQSDNQSRKQQDKMNEAVREFENMIPTTVFNEATDARVNLVV
ncbi:MAG: flagellar hook-length control protein FliK, partial [Spirochaetaceae bacterium]|nr:flagellar hook-length control protein FliK [Spirochaetaceae bacterium]